MLNDNIPESPASSILPVKEEKKYTSRESVLQGTDDLWRQTGLEYYKAYNTGLEIGKKYRVCEIKYAFITGILHSFFEQVKQQIDAEDNLAERQRKQVIASRLYDGMVNYINILKELNINIDEKEIPPIIHGYITAQILHKNYDNENEHKRTDNPN